nr:MAG TPA: peptidoglycan hydrolase [Caudoviricetes sp.]
MAVNIDNAIAWMQARKGKVTYSMEYRDGEESYKNGSKY